MQAHLAAAAQEMATPPGMPPPTGGAGKDAPPVPHPHLTRHRHHPHQGTADAQQQGQPEGQPEAPSAWQRARMQDPRAGTSLVNVARMAFSEHTAGSTPSVPAAEESAAGQCSSMFKCGACPPSHAARRTIG